MKKKYLNKVIVFSLTFILTAVCFSCSRGNEASSSGEKPAPGKVSHTDAGDENDKQKKQKDENASVVSEIEGTDFLLVMEKETEPVYPEDFEIGPLQPSLREAVDGTAPVLEVATAFLDSVTDGSPDYSLIASEKSEFVIRNITDGLEKTFPSSYRIGVINDMGDPVRAEIRLFGEKGSASGTMYFIKSGGWKIYDFHPDFSELENSGAEEEEKWSPAIKSF